MKTRRPEGYAAVLTAALLIPGAAFAARATDVAVHIESVNAHPKGVARFAVSVENVSRRDAEDVRVWVNLPPEGEVVDVDSRCRPSPGILECRLGWLEAERSAGFEIRWRPVNGRASTGVETAVEVSTASRDGNPSNDADRAAAAP